MFWGATPKHPPNVEGMWPGTVQEGGGAALSSPPLFLRPARLRARIRVWYGFLGDPTPFFLFWRGVPLKIHTRPEGSGINFEGNPMPFFFTFWRGFPLISIPDLKGLVWNLGGPFHVIFFLNLGSGFPCGEFPCRFYQ